MEENIFPAIGKVHLPIKICSDLPKQIWTRCVSAVKYISIRTLQTKARSVSRHQGQDIITLWQGLRNAYAPETSPQTPGGMRALSRQEYIQPRGAYAQESGTEEKGASCCLPVQGTWRERTGLWCCCQSSSSHAAPFPSAAHGPARPLCPLAPSRPCILSRWQTAASCLTLTSSSDHHLPTPSPQMVSADTGRGQIYLLLFITCLPYGMAIFAEPKHWALNDSTTTLSLFFSPSLSFSY